MTLIKPFQNRELHVLLNNIGELHHKADLVHSFTKGRSESSKDLTAIEAVELIQYLRKKKEERNEINSNEAEACERKRKRLIGMSYGIGADTVFVKQWCEKFGVYGVKKKFNQYNSRELSGLIAKFSKVEKHRVEKTLEIAGN